MYLLFCDFLFALRPISLLRLSLQISLDSNSPIDSLRGLGIPPLKLKIPHEFKPPESRGLVRRLALPGVRDDHTIACYTIPYCTILCYTIID